MIQETKVPMVVWRLQHIGSPMALVACTPAWQMPMRTRCPLHQCTERPWHQWAWATERSWQIGQSLSLAPWSVIQR